MIAKSVPDPEKAVSAVFIIALFAIMVLWPLRSLGQESWGVDLDRIDHRAHVATGTALTLIGSSMASNLDHDGGPVIDAVLGGIFAMIPLAVYEGIATEQYDNSDMGANLLGVGFGAFFHIAIN